MTKAIHGLGEDTGRLLAEAVRAHPYPLVFESLSGAHLYGFPSDDSDFDIRGVHVLPFEEVAGLDHGPETVEQLQSGAGAIDLVTHDVAKFARLLLNRNGSVLEQLYSPFVVQTTAAHEELRRLGRGCITKGHGLHYLGFAENTWKLFEKSGRTSLKKLLYTFRVLMTGIHLMRTGEVEPDLRRLEAGAAPDYLPGLIERKRSGELNQVDPSDGATYVHDVMALRAELEHATRESRLPERPTSRSDLHHLVVRLRRGDG